MTELVIPNCARTFFILIHISTILKAKNIISLSSTVQYIYGDFLYVYQVHLNKGKQLSLWPVDLFGLEKGF